MNGELNYVVYFGFIDLNKLEEKKQKQIYVLYIIQRSVMLDEVNSFTLQHMKLTTASFHYP